MPQRVLATRQRHMFTLYCNIVFNYDSYDILFNDYRKFPDNLNSQLVDDNVFYI